uniref:Arc-like DNA binding domain-containing protein n=1 Tax=Dulem virus 51 TaxID=3145762 RepID=A0AAU8AV07_9VIRU
MAYASPFSLRLLEEKKKQLEIIAKKNSRSLNKQIEFILNQYIDDYEKVNGPIDKEK